MKAKGIRAVALAASVIVTGHAAAVEQIRDVNIQALNTFSTYVVIEVSPTFNNTDGCLGSAARRAVALDWADIPARKTMLAPLLLAQATGSTISLGTSGCSDVWGGIPDVFKIELEN